MLKNDNNFKQRLNELKKEDIWHQELAQKIMTSDKAVSFRNNLQSKILFTTAVLTSLCAFVFVIGFFVAHGKPTQVATVKPEEIQSVVTATPAKDKATAEEVKMHADVEKYIASEVLETYNGVFSDAPDFQIHEVGYITER